MKKSFDFILSDIPSKPKTIKDIIGSKSVVIYGAGGGFQSFNSFVLNRYSIPISELVDLNQFHTQGWSIISPDNFFSKYKERVKDNFIIIITISNLNIRKEIEERFKRNGFLNVYSSLDFYEYNLIYSDKSLEDNLVNIYKSKIDNIKKAYECLSDNQSRDIFYQIIYSHFYRIPISFDNYDYESQYIVDGIGLIEDEISLLECGAFDGDTLEKFCKKYKKIKLAVALECDLGNYQKITEKIFNDIEKLVLLPIGSGNNNSFVTFRSDENMMSRVIDEESSISLKKDKLSQALIVKCDDIFKNFYFNKVVIDTEGCELESLLGMRRIIAEYNPDLCFAIYHKATDIFHLINEVNQINNKYKFFLRNHSPFICDTVCYAVARN